MVTAPPYNMNDGDDLEKQKDELSLSDTAIPEQSIHSRRSIHTFLLGPVEPGRADLALLACCFVAGMVDSATFVEWGMFVGMQSGNTVILGLSTASFPNDPWAWLDTIVSLSSFLIGCYVTFRITRYFTSGDPYSSRLVIVLVFLAQSLFIVLSAGLSTRRDLVPQIETPAGIHSAAPYKIVSKVETVSVIPALAFQSGMQITCSRLFGLDELPVNVLTSLYCDLLGDPRLFALNNIKRNRRISAAILLLLGSISAAWLLRSNGGLQSVLWVAAGIKFLVAVAVLCFMPSRKSRDFDLTFHDTSRGGV